MAFRVPPLQMLRRLARALGPQVPRRCLSFSYQDVLASRQTLSEVFGYEVVSNLRWRDDAEEILGWHKTRALAAEIPDWHSLLELLGLTPTTLDLAPSRGVEVQFDLNNALPDKYRRAFGLVIDNVSHQVFNIAQVIRNAAESVAVGGYVLHLTPLCMVNQGFYSPSPAVYHDFYTANGFRMAHHSAFLSLSRDQEGYDFLPVIEPVKRMRVYDDYIQLVVAQRVEDAPLVAPIMRKFCLRPDIRRRAGD